MNTKKVILISAATYLVLNFILWALGWMVWLIAWVLCGLAIAKFGEYLEDNLSEKSPTWVSFMACVLGPLTIIPFIIGVAEGVFNFKKLTFLPKIRNPFVWPQKELDKEDKI